MCYVLCSFDFWGNGIRYNPGGSADTYPTGWVRLMVSGWNLNPVNFPFERQIGIYLVVNLVGQKNPTRKYLLIITGA